MSSFSIRQWCHRIKSLVIIFIPVTPLVRDRKSTDNNRKVVFIGACTGL